MPNTSEQFGRTPEIMRRARDPIAIVGVGCRFPGDVFDTESYWNMLVAGQDCIVDVPQDRWSTDRFFDPDPDKTGKIYIKHGGFLKHRLEAFDAAFFGIPPRQADTIDPQQRLLLETTWEAFEDAGIVPEALAGSATGVYVGGFNLDSLLTQLSPLNRRLVNSHTATGMTMTVLSNRISYLFDLRGPSVTMDTACSSSLVAFHHACQAIWNGECSLALTGGVNVMFRPEYSLTMCKGQFLAPDGHCKSFDERADGYARAEGAAIVVLKPLEAARKDGDRIYAIVRGTGVNQDGRTNGISLPNGESQAALIRSVLDQANIAAQQIGYVEAHGTGTAVGDPIEATAIGTVLGKNRPDDMLPLVIGSVKANFGHLEAAAGIAGVIKAALCLEHGQIPPQANLQALNPAIPFADLRLKVPQQLETLPEGEGSVCAAINSFGYGGLIMMEMADAVLFVLELTTAFPATER
jgi:acyl transferase domain-containing protein